MTQYDAKGLTKISQICETRAAAKINSHIVRPLVGLLTTDFYAIFANE
jgi:hypothetical protein